MIAQLMRNLERPAFMGLVMLLLGPIIAQGTWLPLVHFFGPSGSAGAVTGSAMVVGVACVLVCTLLVGKSPLFPLVAGTVTALGATLALSLGLPGLISLLIVAAVQGGLSVWLPSQLPVAMNGLASRHKVLTAFYALLSLIAVFSTARLSVFMGDLSRSDLQTIPGDAFLAKHSCLTAYVHASTLVRQDKDNLYAVERWQGADGKPAVNASGESPYQPFTLDYFAYPPPFLLAMLPIATLEGDFPAQRALWFGINGLVVAVGLWIVARWVEGPTSHRMLLLSPIFLGSLPVLATLQVGNVQACVVVLSVLAMVAFDCNRPALGGAMLAFAILSKLSPGVLGIVLLAQRRWRDVLWTAGFGVCFVAASVLVHGANPLVSFMTYAFPRLASGEAFAFMDDDVFSIWTNQSPFGWSFKLHVLGFPVGDPWVLARHVGHIYTLALLVLVSLATRQHTERHARALSWMAVLVLSALQSPFAPGYVIVGLLWATVLLSVEVERFRGGVGVVVLWLLLTVIPPISMSAKVAYSLVTSALILSVSAWLIVRKHEADEPVGSPIVT